MNKYSDWPKAPTWWRGNGTIFVSIPFTWNLPEIRSQLKQLTVIPNDRVVVGGPAVKLTPEYFSKLPFIVKGDDYPGVLQKVNPWATRTSEGCPRKCRFCGVGQGLIEGKFRELDHWPDLPIICDNNLLASSQGHFDKVIDKLLKWPSPDFNQGLDLRLLNKYHAERFSQLKRPRIQLACDACDGKEKWLAAIELLLSAGVRKTWISTYALIGFDSDPTEAWDRCEFINKFGTCNPMWFHPLDAVRKNQITQEQEKLGWSDSERIKIMRRFYKAKFGGYSR